MRSAEQQLDAEAPEPGPIAAAVAASADGLENRDLESVLMDASLFGHVACHTICHLGFERREPPDLTEHETQIVYWMITQMSWMVDQAKDAFYKEGARKGGSP